MKETMKTEGFKQKDWEDLASIFSGEKSDTGELTENFRKTDSLNTGEVWKKLKEMNKTGDNINVDRAWDKLYSKLKNDGLVSEERQPKVRKMNIPFLRIAAAALILVSVGSILIYLNSQSVFSSTISIVTGNDQNNKVVDLPDGSKIYLNRNSEFSYHENFGKRKRDVTLKGEAFFEIAPDVSKPFVIDAGKARVRVVGTSFNVITDNGKAAVEVYVKTGRVELSDNEGLQKITLDPGYVGTMDSKSPERRLNDNANYISWKTGRLEYNGQRLDVVFRDLKRVYNMDIVADNKEILENSWTSPIDNQSPETIIRLICISFNLAYTKDGDVYHLDKK